MRNCRLPKSSIELLLAFWRDRGVGLNNGASADTIAAFDASAGVQLTPEFHELYASSDGMASEAYDDLIFGWWSLERILAELRDPQHTPLVAPPALDFADGLIESHRYGVVLAGPDRGAIVAHWHGEEPEMAANSLTEFADSFRRRRACT